MAESRAFVSEALNSLDNAQLKRAFDAPDLLGKVLRTQIEIEAQMDRLIEHFSKVKINDGMGFELKCTILRAMGWDAGQLETIRNFGSLRNKLAHKKSYDSVNPKIEALQQKIVESHGLPNPKILEIGSLQFNNEPILKLAEMTKEQKLVYVGMGIATLLAAAPDTHIFQGFKALVVFGGSAR